jgi:hypothetical protein
VGAWAPAWALAWALAKTIAAASATAASDIGAMADISDPTAAPTLKRSPIAAPRSRKRGLIEPDSVTGQSPCGANRTGPRILLCHSVQRTRAGCIGGVLSPHSEHLQAMFRRIGASLCVANRQLRRGVQGSILRAWS